MPKVTVGDWERRDGQKQEVAVVAADYAAGVYGSSRLYRWSADTGLSTSDRCLDLIRPWREPVTREVIMTVFSDDRMQAFFSDQKNYCEKDDQVIARLTLPITYRPGDGLEERT